MNPSLDTFFEYRRPRDLDPHDVAHHPVIVVGAGPIGLAMALDWVRHGHDVLVLAASDSLSAGSRAICFAKRTLEICDRLGFGEAVASKGVSWNVGKVFRQDGLLYEFNLLPETGQRFPAFVNLQQYYFEHYQLRALAGHRISRDGCGRVDLRWNNRVVGVTASDDRVEVTVECPDGNYALTCDWLIACDGAGSPVRKMMGLSSAGQVFRDRFLIADVKIARGAGSAASDASSGSASKFFARTERWFWFDPPFHRNQSALLHRQADDVWRLDFQLGWQADPEIEKQPERVLPRIRAMLGPDVEFELEWVSIYTFQCRRMERFTHGRVIFAGDAAHQVSPFGARGANSGIQDVDNLAWKLDLVVRGAAPRALLDTYDTERIAAADENILNSTRSTDFITPKSAISRTFRDAVLELAAKYPFARKLVNSGRLSVPAHYRESSLNTADVEPWPASTAMNAPGSPAMDAPVVVAVDGERVGGWLLSKVGGAFTVVVFCDDASSLPVMDTIPSAVGAVELRKVIVARSPSLQSSQPAAMHGGTRLLIDRERLAAARYAPAGHAIYLLRPDQHVAGRRIGHDIDWIPAAVALACGHALPSQERGQDAHAERRTEPVAAG